MHKRATRPVSDSIHPDPLLADVSELLHRMEICKTVEPFRWMATDALRKLRQYEAKLIATGEEF